MTRNEAKNISLIYKFTRRELYDILVRAYNELPDNFWTKRNACNKSMDNGFYFNFCLRLLNFKEGENEDETMDNMVAYRILHIFGDFSEIQPVKKGKVLPPITMSQKPKL